MRCFAAGAAALVISASAAAQEQRSFPTGSPGSVVSYLDAGGPGHPTGCVVSITAGLPALAISINVFSNNKASFVAGNQLQFLAPKPGSDAGIAVGPDFLFGKVNGETSEGTFHIVTIDLIPGPYGNAMDAAFKAINRIVYGANIVSVVADDIQIASGPVPQQPGIADALIACQKYLVSRQ